ncbi:hypothetical protein [Patulibacter minatonensis]|uniref:hypothetical protein n=1 Tax=Patulibacter minatonensis TaxID=298163 RepID=UPI0004796C3E|nr:hypothetical protein [Patulibacter minatonensis]
MPVHRRITALLATLTTLAGGSFVTSAAADTDGDAGERGARTTLQSAPRDHANAHVHHARTLAGALGVSDRHLAVVLRELRAERPASDLVGARPAVRSAAERARERAAYAAALAAKVGVPVDVAVAALDGTSRPAPAGGPQGPPTALPVPATPPPGT